VISVASEHCLLCRITLRIAAAAARTLRDVLRPSAYGDMAERNSREAGATVAGSFQVPAGKEVSLFT